MTEFWIKFLVCFLAGAGAGIGTGFAGMSACAVIGPMLITFLGFSSYQAIGVGLASDIIASAVSAWTYHKSGNLDIKDNLLLLFVTLGVTFVCSILAKFLPDHAVGMWMQISMVIIGLRFLLKPVSRTREQMKQVSPREHNIKSILGGIYIGAVCGLMGAGGGMMLLFVLTSLLGYEMHIAVGTSVFIMTFTALTGGVSHLVIGGLPDIQVLILCVVFTLLWARISARIANKVSSKTLNRVVGTVMVLTGAVILAVDYLI